MSGGAHHKAYTQTIHESRAVDVEDLAVSNLGCTRLATIHDAGVAAFVDNAGYEAVKQGRTFVKMDRTSPSSGISA